MNRDIGIDGTVYEDGRQVSPRQPKRLLELHDTEPAPPPEAYDPSARQALAKIDWQDVPPEVTAELYSLLAYRCRKKPGSCFCGVHLTNVDAPELPDSVPIRALK